MIIASAVRRHVLPVQRHAGLWLLKTLTISTNRHGGERAPWDFRHVFLLSVFKDQADLRVDIKVYFQEIASLLTHRSKPFYIININMLEPLLYN